MCNLASGLVRTARCTCEPHARARADADRREERPYPALADLWCLVSDGDDLVAACDGGSVESPPILTPLPGKQCGHRQWIGDLFKRSCAMGTALLAGHSSDDTPGIRHDGGHDRGLLGAWAR